MFQAVGSSYSLEKSQKKKKDLKGVQINEIIV